MVGPVAAGGTGAGPLPSSSGGPAGGTGRTSGALGAVVPSGWGAPGAFGSALGSKASDLRGLTVTGASITTGGAAAGGGGETTAAGAGGSPERSPKRYSTSCRNFWT